MLVQNGVDGNAVDAKKKHGTLHRNSGRTRWRGECVDAERLTVNEYYKERTLLCAARFGRVDILKLLTQNGSNDALLQNSTDVGTVDEDISGVKKKRGMRRERGRECAS